MEEPKGFTLIEILIVVILLGILATIIVPRFRASSDDTKLTVLKADLNIIRDAIRLYYYQHGNSYPGARTLLGVEGASNTECSKSFVQQLTRYTDQNGKVSAVKDANHKYGPYLKGGSLPANPFNNLSDVTCDRNEDDITVRDSTGASTGWKFYPRTGVFMAADGAHDSL
jgi:prepilin-type N-terminal cleavage/methylation domain-containing protein